MILHWLIPILLSLACETVKVHHVTNEGNPTERIQSVENASRVPLNDSSSNNSFFPPFGHGLSKPFSLFIAMCFTLIIIVAVICNLVLIFSILFVRKLHSFLNVFIANMAVSDLMTAMGTIPFDVELMIKGSFSHGEVLCGIMQTIFLVSLPSSVLCLTLLTAERFITVVFPLRLNQLITKKRVVMAIMISWTYVLLVALFPFMLNGNAVKVVHGHCFLYFPLEFNIFLVSVNFFIPIVFICVVNVVLLMIARGHAMKQASVVSRLSHQRSDGSEGSVAGNKKKQKLLKQESVYSSSSWKGKFKATKRISLLVGVFLVCWLSYIIIVAVNFVNGYGKTPRQLIWIGNVINYSSTAINPVLYGLLNKTIRNEVILKSRKEIKYYMPWLEKYSFIHGKTLSEMTRSTRHTKLGGNYSGLRRVLLKKFLTNPVQV